MPIPKNKTRGDDLRWRALAFFIGLPLLLVLTLTAVSAASDGGRIPSELAAAARETGVMLCSEGRIDHGDGSLVDRLWRSGNFRCTAWRMRQRVFDASTGTTAWPSSPKR
jgi:hypothetical protein